MKKKTLHRILAMTLSLAMFLILTACGNSDSGPSNTASAEPGNDGTAIVLNLDGEPSSLNPSLMGGTTSANLMLNLCYGMLWRVNADDSVSVDLAESYEINEEELTLTVHLRDGLTFADGSALTAEDVVCSIQTAAADSGSNTSTIDLERTQTIDETTVQIGLNAMSYSTMVDISCIGIISKEWTEDGANAEKKAADILCSGPYVLQSWSTGQDMVYVKNENYWNSANVKYDQITVKCIADETTRFLDYQNGGVDVCMLTRNENIDSVEDGTVAGTVSVVTIQSVQGLAFDTENIDTFKNENLRLAIAHAIDVEALVEAYCGERYTVAKSLFSYLSPYYEEAYLEYDPELAKEYLQKYYDETGTTEVSIQLTCRSGDVGATLSEAIQFQLNEVLGINVEVTTMDSATYFDAQAKGEQYASIVPLARGYYDPAKYMNSWLPESSNSIMHLNDDNLNALLQETVNDTTLSEEERAEKLAELQREVVETGKFIPMFDEFACFALNGAVTTMDNCITGNGKLAQTFWLTELPELLTTN